MGGWLISLYPWFKGTRDPKIKWVANEKAFILDAAFIIRTMFGKMIGPMFYDSPNFPKASTWDLYL